MIRGRLVMVFRAVLFLNGWVVCQEDPVTMLEGP